MTIEQNTSATPAQFEVCLQELQERPAVIGGALELAHLAKRLEDCEYEAAPENAHLKLRAEWVGNGALVRGHVEARIKTRCSACLGDTTIPVESAISTLMLQKQEVTERSGDEELTPEDLESEWFEGSTLILDDLVMDSLMLEMPMNPKCPTACPGPPHFDIEEAKPQIDPRLAPLASVNIAKEK